MAKSKLILAIATLLKMGKEIDLKLEELKTKDGVMLFAQVFEPGEPVFIMQDDAQVPVPVGEYELEDGRILVVAEEGIIGEMKEAAGEAPEGEAAEASADTVTPAEKSYTVSEIRDLIEAGLSEQKKIYEDKIAALETKLSALGETKPIKPNPEGKPVEMNEQPPKGTLNRVLAQLYN